MEICCRLLVAFLISSLIVHQHSGVTVHSIGVNYGMVADNLPPPAQVADFLHRHTTIDRVKLFDANPDTIRAFANSNISLTVTVPNGDIPQLTTVRGARRWLDAHVIPFHPATKIDYLAVGTEVLHWIGSDLIPILVPAMENLHRALILSRIGGIKVSTPHSLGILVPSDPPSTGRFRPDIDRSILAPMLQFLRKTKSPFMVNPYPYFAYTPANADFVLFRSKTAVVDKFTKKAYTNKFDELMDTVYSAMKKLGYGDVEIVVAEIGWPSVGEPSLTHVNVENARWHNLNVLRRTSSGVGTPLMPNRTFHTYLFALFNENQKPGSIAEKNFGLFRPDFRPVYDIGIMRRQPIPTPTPTPATPSTGKKWCVPKLAATDSELQANLNFVCQNGVDCSPIQPGGSCFDPNTIRGHATYAMNAWYQEKGRHDYDCDFAKSGLITSSDPSYGLCKFVA